MGKTSIEWTDHSWPVVNGCRRVSPGCGAQKGEGGCYAERLAATRLSKTAKYRGLAIFGKNGPRWTGKTRLWEKDLAMPLRLRKPSRIFVADMGDLFYEGVADEDIAAVFGVMAAAPQHIFQVLTKRPERMRAWFGWADAQKCHGNTVTEILRSKAIDRGGFRAPDGSMPKGPGRALLGFDVRWPLPNVHVGVSAESQECAAERIPHLLRVPAAAHFVSYEPALEGVSFARWIDPGSRVSDDELDAPDGAIVDGLERVGDTWHRRVGLDWVIVGGESGPGARPFHLAWARAVIEECRVAKIACFVKQLGAYPISTEDDDRRHCGDMNLPNPFRLRLADSHGGDMAEWPEDLRVREFPTAQRSAP